MPDSTRAGAPARWRRVLATGLPVTPLLRWAVLVHAAPYGESWRSGCPRCGAGFTGAAAKALRPAGRCGGCGERIGARPYRLELAALVATALVVLAVLGDGWPWPAMVALAGWAAAAVVLGFVDLAVHRLPDRLTLPAAGWVLGWLGIAALVGGTGASWLRAAAAAAVCGVGFSLVALIARGAGFGWGDVKLVLGVGALLGWLGWSTVIAGLFLAFLVNGLVAAGRLVTRRVGWRDMQPFGPFLAGGTLAALAWAGLASLGA